MEVVVTIVSSSSLLWWLLFLSVLQLQFYSFHSFVLPNHLHRCKHSGILFRSNPNNTTGSNSNKNHYQQRQFRIIGQIITERHNFMYKNAPIMTPMRSSTSSHNNVEEDEENETYVNHQRSYHNYPNTYHRTSLEDHDVFTNEGEMTHNNDDDTPLIVFSSEASSRSDFNLKLIQLSVFSNCIFLAAGLLYLSLALWDIFEGEAESSSMFFYSFISAAAPTTYLLNSYFDIELAKKIMEDYSEQQLILNYNSNSNTEDDNYNINEAAQWPLQAAHRRDLLASRVFAFAAMAATLEVFVSNLDFSDTLSTILDGTAAHTYMISALIALADSNLLRFRPRTDTGDDASAGLSNRQWLDFQDSDFVDNLGDAFFFLGSVIDVVICDGDYDNVLILALLSALFWVIDACLYLRSDSLMLKRRGQRIQRIFFNHHNF